jgi:hypothetical protein
MTAVSAVSTRDARIYRVNAWREMKGRPELYFSPRLTGCFQLDIDGTARRDYEDRKPWGWRTSSWAKWNKPVGYFRAEVKTALRRSSKIPGGSTFPAWCNPITPKEMAKWRKSDPRPTPVTFYDGKLDTKRAAL